MYADIKFDREINPEIHYISPGGYNIKAAGKEYTFDFYEFCGNKDVEDPTILHCEMRNLDTSEFPQAKEFEKVCNQVEEIIEFFVFTGEYNDPKIEAIAVLNLAFCTDELGLIEIPKELLKDCLMEKKTAYE